MFKPMAKEEDPKYSLGTQGYGLSRPTTRIKEQEIAMKMPFPSTIPYDYQESYRTLEV